MIIIAAIALALLSGPRDLESTNNGSTLNQKLYASVPESDRESLQKAIDGFLALRKEFKWIEIYQILDNDEHLSRDEFARRSKNQSRLVQFVPSSVSYIPPEDVWEIHGCAVFDPAWPGRQKGVFSGFKVRQTAKGWRFRDIGVVLLKDEPGGTRPCTLDNPGGVPAVPTQKKKH